MPLTPHMTFRDTPRVRKKSFKLRNHIGGKIAIKATTTVFIGARPVKLIILVKPSQFQKNNSVPDETT